MKFIIDGAIEFNETKDEVTIRVATSDRMPLQYQDVLDTVVDLLVSHYNMIALPVERGEDGGLH